MAVLETHGPTLVDPTDRLCNLLDVSQTLIFTGDLKAVVVALNNAIGIAVELAYPGPQPCCQLQSIPGYEGSDEHSDPCMLDLF